MLDLQGYMHTRSDSLHTVRSSMFEVEWDSKAKEAICLMFFSFVHFLVRFGIRSLKASKLAKAYQLDGHSYFKVTASIYVQSN